MAAPASAHARALLLTLLAVAAAVVCWFAFATPPVAHSPGSAPPVGEGARTPPPVGARAEAGAEEAETQANPAHPIDRQPLTTATTGDVQLRCVWASDGAPVPECDVWRYRVDPRGDLGPVETITCDEHGEATLRSLPPGTFAFRAGSGARVAVTVEPGRLLEAGLRITEAATVRGKVVDERGQPIGEARIETSSYSLSRAAAVTAADGRFSLRLASKGEIWAHKPDWQPSLLRVIAGSEDDVVLTLEGGGRGLAGTVLDPQGRPVAGAFVAVAVDVAGPRERARRAPVVLRCDEHGRFHTREVPPGTHTVYALADGFAFAEAEVAIAADAPPPDITLRLRKGATVHGRALTGEHRDQPVVNLSMLIFRERRLPGLAAGMSDRLVRRNALTDESGSYRFTAVPPGSMWVVALGKHTKEKAAALEDGQVFEWNPDLAPPGSRRIRGRLQGPGGEPLAGWMVHTSNLNVRVPESSQATTDTEGAFALVDLRDQPYELSASAPGAGSLVVAKKRAQPGEAELVWRLASLPADNGAILGRLLGPDGQPFEGASIIARSEGGLWRQGQIEPGGGGAFRIADLPPGTWILSGYRKDYGTAVIGEHRITARAEIDIGSHRLEPLGRALVRVRGAEATRPSLRLTADHDTADKTSEFEPRGDAMRSKAIPPGRYRLSLCGEGIAPVERSVQIGPGDDTVVWIDATPAPTVAIEFAPDGLAGESWRDGLKVEVLDGNGGGFVDRFFSVDGGRTFTWRVGLLPGAYTIEATSYQDAPRKGRATLIVPPSPAAPPAVTVRLAVQKE